MRLSRDPVPVLWVIVCVAFIPTNCQSREIIWVCAGFRPTTQHLCLTSCGWTSCLNRVSPCIRDRRIRGSFTTANRHLGFYVAVFVHICCISTQHNLHGKGNILASSLLNSVLWVKKENGIKVAGWVFSSLSVYNSLCWLVLFRWRHLRAQFNRFLSESWKVLFCWLCKSYHECVALRTDPNSGLQCVFRPHLENNLMQFS